MSQPSWSDSARTALASRATDLDGPPLRVAVLGIGQELRGDDGAGPAVARGLAARLPLPALPHLLVLDAGPAPESLTGPLRRFRPDVVVLVDAAHLGEPAGTVRWLGLDQLRGVAASSHTMPPTLLAEYLTAELGCAVALLGTQPLDTRFGEPLSEPVRRSVARVVRKLAGLLGASGGHHGESREFLLTSPRKRVIR